MANTKKNTPNSPGGPDSAEAESKRILDRVARESESVGTSSMARSGEQFKKRLSGIDGNEDDNDPIEVLGKRIGRGLGWIAVIFLIIYLISIYVV